MNGIVAGCLAVPACATVGPENRGPCMGERLRLGKGGGKVCGGGGGGWVVVVVRGCGELTATPGCERGLRSVQTRIAGST